MTEQKKLSDLTDEQVVSLFFDRENGFGSNRLKALTDQFLKTAQDMKSSIEKLREFGANGAENRDYEGFDEALEPNIDHAVGYKFLTIAMEQYYLTHKGAFRKALANAYGIELGSHSEKEQDPVVGKIANYYFQRMATIWEGQAKNLGIG